MSTQQTWAPIPGWPDQYQAGQCGCVRSVARSVPYADGRVARKQGQLLASHLRGGHPYVTLAASGVRKTRRVARLVLGAHVGPMPAGHCVAYADGDPRNVALANLSYAPRGKHKE